MTEKKFWKLVKSLKWKERYKTHKLNTEQIKIEFLTKISPAELQSFRDHYRKNYKFVSAFVNAALGINDIYISDDSFSDLVAHIIGLGEDSILAAAFKYSVITNIVESKDYGESFEYLIPFMGDYSKLDLNTYIQQAEEYMKITKDLKESDKLGDQMTVDNFLQAISVRNWDLAIRLADRVYEYWYSEFGSKANLQVHDRYNGYGVPNLADKVRETLPIILKLHS